MKTLLPLLLASTRLLFAQPTTVTLTGPASVTPGNSFNATLSIAGTGTQGIVDLQWSLVLPAGFTLGTPILASSEPSGDVVQCGPVICLIWGSLTAMQDGTLATIPVTVAGTAALGTQSLNVSGIFAAAAALGGVSVNGVVAGTPYSIKVLSKCDFNGDGVVNVADVQAVVNSLLNATACPITAASGGCTAITVVMEESVAAGVTACKL